MKTLHYFPGNASLAPHMLLHELGVHFELQLVDRNQGEQRSAAYLRLNPNGQIPVWVDGDLVLYEAAAICLHLADTHPAACLAPPLGTPERAQMLKWLMWMTNTLQAYLMHFFYPERLVDAGNTAGAEQVRHHAQQRALQCLKLLDEHLALQRGPWMLGPDFSLLDPYALMLCRWTRTFGGQPARSWPHIGPYLQHVLHRPAVQRAFAAEALPAPWV
jgi:glutathione S-transferase